MKRTHSIGAIGITLLMGITAVSAPLAASASQEGKRNTTYALGAVAAALLLTQKNKLPGILAAGGAAYAFTQINKGHDRRDHDLRDYRNDYNNNWERGHDRNNDYRTGEWDRNGQRNDDNSQSRDRNGRTDRTR